MLPRQIGAQRGRFSSAAACWAARNSTASYTVSLLNPKVIRDVRLEQHGLRVLERPMQNFLPLPDGRALTAGPAQANTVAAIRGSSNRDAERLPACYQMLDAAVTVLRW